MAAIKTTDNDVQLFTGTDAYRFDIDNRPLRNLIENDILINAEVEALTTEVTNARSDSSTGATIIYSSLDARLEAMGLVNAGNASVSYAIFQSMAERNRTLFQSGWLQQPSGKSYNGYLNGFTGDDFGSLFGSNWLGLTNYPNVQFLNNDYAGQYLPIPLLVNGWLIKILDMQAGGAAAYGNHTLIKYAAAPTSGGRQDMAFLEVWLEEVDADSPIFWFYGSPQYKAATFGENNPIEDSNYTTDPLDPRVVHSLTRLPNGNWLQVRHRFRTVSNIDPLSNPDGFTGANATLVNAQGAQTTPVNSKPFTNMLAEMGDAGLWRAGNGASDTAALGTYDGYVYAVPMTMVHRRSTEDFTMANQNGTKVVGNSASGNIASGLSGRPDGKYYDAIHRDDFLDMRHMIGGANIEYERLMQQALAEVLKGSSRLQWQQLQYSAGTQPVYGNRLLSNDTIFSDAAYPAYATDANLGSNTNYVKDYSVSGDPFSYPDGVRQIFASSPIPQRFEFVIDAFGLTSDQTVAGFITVTSNGSDRIVTVNPTVLSGSNGNTVGDRKPTWYWQADGAPATVTVGGTATARTFTFNIGSRSTGKVLCNLDLMFPKDSGTKELPNAIQRQDYFDGSATHTSHSTGLPNYPFAIKKDSTGKFWVAEYYGRKVSCWQENSDGSMTKLSSANQTIDSSTLTNWAADGFSYLTGLAVQGNPLDGTGAIWVADWLNSRIRKYTYNTGTQMWALVQTVGGAGNTFSVGGTPRNFGNDGATSNGPYSIALSADNATLYAADYYRHVVWKFSTADMSTATVFAGVLDSRGNTSEAPFKIRNPISVSMDADGTSVLISDYVNNRVLKLDSAGALVVQFTNSPDTDSSAPEEDSSGGGSVLDSKIQNSDFVKIIGVPGSGTEKYLVVGGSGLDAANQQRVWKLDANFNVEAFSNFYDPTQTRTRIGGITVDSQTSPNFVRVGLSDPNYGIMVLNYSNLSKNVFQNLGGWYLGMQHVPAAGTVTGARIFVTLSVSSGRYTRVYKENSFNNAYLDYVATIPFPDDPDNPGTPMAVADQRFSQMRTIGGTPQFYQLMTNGYSKSYIYRWTISGTEWVRSASPVISSADIGGVPWAIDQDTDGHIYLAFPGIPGVGGLSHVVTRHKWTGAAFAHPGDAGNTPGVFGVDGINGSDSSHLSAPTGLHVSNDGTRLAVVGKTTGLFAQSTDFNNDGVVNSYDDVDQTRIVLLDTAAASTAEWEGTGSPYVKDSSAGSVTVGTSASTIAVPMGRPTQAISSGEDVYILDRSNHVLLRLKRKTAGDNKSYQLVGKFGVYGEPGTDHAHLTSPHGVALSNLNTSRLIIADSYSSRLLSIHNRMAGVSRASGNIETMTPLTQTGRLRVWSSINSYQGVGSTLFASGSREWIWAKQILAASEAMFVTTLGRSPLPSMPVTPGDFAGLIDRLPLAGKANGLTAASFDSSVFGVTSHTRNAALMPLYKLPVLSYGMTVNANFTDDATEDSLLAYVRADANLTETRCNRGFNIDNGQAGTFFSIGADLTRSVNHVCFLPYLIHREGRVYLAVITSISTDVSSTIGHANSAPYSAIDLFEVPGRLLAG